MALPRIESVSDPSLSKLRAERFKALCASYNPNAAQEWLRNVCAAVQSAPPK
jgi:hypothetical protein